MKRLLAVAFAVLIAAGLALYLVVVRPLVSPAAETSVAEAALAAPDLVVLAALNVRQAVFLERWFLGAPLVRTSQAAVPRPAEQRTLVEHLAAAGVDVRRDVDHVLYGLYPAAERARRQALVVVGTFDAAAVEQYVIRELHGVPRPSGVRTAYEVHRVNPAACEDVTTWLVTLDPRWILVSDPTSHASLLTRMTQPAPPGQTDELAWWRPLAGGDVLSVGMWRPRDVERTVTTPVWRGSVHALSTQVDSVEHLYVGLGARTIPPSGRLRIVLDATDAARMKQKMDVWQEAVRQTRAEWAATAPSLGPVFDSLSAKADGNRQTVEFVVDRALVSHAERAVTELLAAVFAGLRGPRPAPATAPPAERVDQNPPTFVTVAGASALPPYDPAAMFAEDVEQVQGPFGMRLGAMRLASTPDAGLELVVESFAAAVPNVVEPGGRVQLVVDSVKASTGRELLQSEPCGPRRNLDPADFAAPGGQRLRATKAVRLVADADPHTVQSISGHVELRLPTRVETLSVAHPAPGAALTSHGTTLTITRTEGGVLGYQVTGTPDRVLHVSALNAGGQPLAMESRFKSDFLLGDGLVVETHYAGRIERVDAVFVVDEEDKRWPFTLADLSMAGPPAAAGRDPLPDFRPYGVRALRHDVAKANPFELSLDRAQSMFGTRLDFTLLSPVLPNLERAFTVGRLQLKRIELKDGTIVTPPPGSTAPTVVRTAWDTAVRFGSTSKNGTLTKSLVLVVDAKIAPDTIKAVSGLLTMQFPRTVRTLRLDDLTPGEHAETPGMAVTVRGRGHRSLTLQTRSAGERVLYVRVESASGQPVMSFSPNITESPDGAWTFELSPQGAAAHADVVFAGDVELKDYPFRLEPR